MDVGRVGLIGVQEVDGIIELMTSIVSKGERARKK